MRWLKWLGLAGLFGVAAVGIGVVVQQRRQQRSWVDYGADELRERLRERLATATSGNGAQPTAE